MSRVPESPTTARAGPPVKPGDGTASREQEEPDRLRAALRQRYLGTALVGLAILIYWSLRVLVARWVG